MTTGERLVTKPDLATAPRLHHGRPDAERLEHVHHVACELPRGLSRFDSPILRVAVHEENANRGHVGVARASFGRLRFLLEWVQTKVAVAVFLAIEPVGGSALVGEDPSGDAARSLRGELEPLALLEP